MKKRIVTIALVVALLATCFAGTYAYLIDSEAQKNTFTTGNVLITLDEAEVKNVNGNLVATGERIVDGAKAQTYHLFPAMTVTKDPTITLDASSEDAWIAAKITFSKPEVYALLSGGVLKTDAVVVEQKDNVVYVYVKAVQSKNAKIVLFDTLTVPYTYGNTEMTALNGMTIDVKAYAVQANGFATCQAAMQAAFSGEFPANP